MKAKKIILAAVAGTALLAAAGAQARDGRWDNGHRDNGRHYGQHHHHGARVVVRPAYRPYYAPRYVAATPYYYAPPPPVYYQPAPAIYGRIPLGHNASIGFSVPLY
jgi:hypothetical protein